MTPDLKPVDLSLNVSPVLLLWIIIVHVLSAGLILFLSYSFGLNLLITIVLLSAICFGCIRCYQKYQCPTWGQVSFDGDKWTLFSTQGTQGSQPVLVELTYYYRFGKSWILGFRQLEKKRKSIVVPLLSDGCDEKVLKKLSHLLLMANV